MKVAELIEILKTHQQNAEVLTGTSIGTLVRIQRVGTVQCIPVRKNRNLLPGNEWRVRLSPMDEPEAKTETHLYIG